MLIYYGYILIHFHMNLISHVVRCLYCMSCVKQEETPVLETDACIRVPFVCVYNEIPTSITGTCDLVNH